MTHLPRYYPLAFRCVHKTGGTPEGEERREEKRREEKRREEKRREEKRREEKRREEFCFLVALPRSEILLNGSGERSSRCGGDRWDRGGMNEKNPHRLQTPCKQPAFSG
jgi:hypothetical protein